MNRHTDSIARLGTLKEVERFKQQFDAAIGRRRSGPSSADRWPELPGFDTVTTLEEDLERGLLPTLRSASAGQISVPRAAGPQVQVAAFTPRERQVVHMAALGFKNSEIGQKLFLAESTVKSHLSSAFAKLGVRSRSEAATVLLDGSPGHELLGVGFDT